MAALLTKLQETLKTLGGEIGKVESWGKRRLAYDMRKQREGTYAVLESQGGAGHRQGVRAAAEAQRAGPPLPHDPRSGAASGSGSAPKPPAAVRPWRRSSDGEPEQGLPDRQPDAGAGAAVHAERHRGGRSPAGGQPELHDPGRGEARGDLLPHGGGVGQAGRELRRVPRQGQPDHGRGAAADARLGNQGRSEAQRRRGRRRAGAVHGAQQVRRPPRPAECPSRSRRAPAKPTTRCRSERTTGPVPRGGTSHSASVESP